MLVDYIRWFFLLEQMLRENQEATGLENKLALSGVTYNVCVPYR